MRELRTAKEVALSPLKMADLGPLMKRLSGCGADGSVSLFEAGLRMQASGAAQEHKEGSEEDAEGGNQSGLAAVQQLLPGSVVDHLSKMAACTTSTSNALSMEMDQDVQQVLVDARVEVRATARPCSPVLLSCVCVLCADGDIQHAKPGSQTLSCVCVHACVA